MKLFLSSFFSSVAGLCSNFIGGDCAGKKVVFIPTAAIREKVNFYVGSDKKAFAKLGMLIDELEVSGVPKKEIAKRISAADYVFVEGGNTFFLLQELRRSGADKIIVEHIKNGKPNIGAYAGSMVLSKNIEYAKYMDNPKAAPDLNGDFTGLSVVDFYVVPHCANFPFRKAAERIISEYSDKHDLRPISNNQAIAVAGRKIEVLTSPGKK
jgi:dipeptidase E